MLHCIMYWRWNSNHQAFQERGFPIVFGPLGRETKTFEERQLARDVLEENQSVIQDLLAEHGITATVIIPVRDIGSVLCHSNGDILTREAYHGFDRLYILTLAERVKSKKKEFESLPKIEIIGFRKQGVE